MQAQRYVKASEDRYFKDLDMVVSDWLLIVGNREYDLSTVSSCEVIAEPRKPDWPRFLITQLKLTSVAAPVWAISTFFNWCNAWLLPAIWASITIRDALRELGEPTQYALVLNTKAGPIPVVTRSENTLALAADEITKRIARLPLLPEPAPPALTQPDQQQLGEPTRRMT